MTPHTLVVTGSEWSALWAWNPRVQNDSTHTTHTLNCLWDILLLLSTIQCQLLPCVCSGVRELPKLNSNSVLKFLRITAVHTCDTGELNMPIMKGEHWYALGLRHKKAILCQNGQITTYWRQDDTTVYTYASSSLLPWLSMNACCINLFNPWWCSCSQITMLKYIMHLVQSIKCMS